MSNNGLEVLLTFHSPPSNTTIIRFSRNWNRLWVDLLSDGLVLLSDHERRLFLQRGHSWILSKEIVHTGLLLYRKLLFNLFKKLIPSFDFDLLLLVWILLFWTVDFDIIILEWADVHHVERGRDLKLLFWLNASIVLLQDHPVLLLEFSEKLWGLLFGLPCHIKCFLRYRVGIKHVNERRRVLQH